MTMETIAVRVGPKYQIVIPRAVREILQLHPYDTLLFLVSGDSVVLRNRPASFTEAMRGLHKDIWPADTADCLEKERATWE
jgi:AbrB family looped-hinge helix DNA binding protein